MLDLAEAPSGPIPRVGQLSLGDIEVAYDEIDGDGIPLVLLHGLTGHRADFLPLLPRLAGRRPGLRMLAPDLRGHGDSTHTGDASSFGFERLVADLVRFLDGCGVERCHLLGHSFGGMISLRFALAYPARLASLLLVSTSPFSPEVFTAETFERSGEIARTRGMAFLQALIEQRARSTTPTRPSDLQTARWSASYWPHHRHRYRSMEALAYQELGLAMVGQVPVTDRLAELSLPTTVLVGLDDEAFLDGSARLALDIPGAAFVRIADAGHHPHRESPSAWLDAVCDHLDRTARPR
ncbi:MAG: alpha/beta fold hydrolase [Deltaproteobacteria bacterium]|nr:alpha/beta fold hydrolase [Deltaproteobacteria bacterium]